MKKIILSVRLENSISHDYSSNFTVKESPRFLSTKEFQKFLEGDPELKKAFSCGKRIVMQTHNEKVFLYTDNVIWEVNGSYSKGMVILLPGESELIKIGNTTFIFECQLTYSSPTSYKETTLDKIRRAFFSSLASLFIKIFRKR